MDQENHLSARVAAQNYQSAVDSSRQSFLGGFDDKNNDFHAAQNAAIDDRNMIQVEDNIISVEEGDNNLDSNRLKVKVATGEDMGEIMRNKDGDESGYGTPEDDLEINNSHKKRGKD